MSEVFYRKWRPRRLDQVVGQESVARTIRNAVAQDRVAHAYLFCGPRGTGKTSTARILARAVNCLEPQDGEPDNVCDSCVAFKDGRSMDLIEIDAASNRGIDDIRSLREKVNYSPTAARYKVYIIDEVHMLTDAAFNALLKTLEEPPAHAIFVLATTEAHKLPLTIVSRCQRFDFRRIPLETSVARLAELCAAEDIEASTEALTLIARASAGSLRDAQNVLERALVSYGSPLGDEQVRDLLELGSEERALELVGHVVDRAAKDGLTVINEVAGEGVDLRQFHRGVMEYLRAVLLLKSGADAPLGYTEEVRSEMEAQAARASLEHLLRAVKTFAGAEVRRNSSSPLPLELAMVESALDVQAVPAPAEHVPAAAAPRAAPRQAPPAAPARPRPAAPAPRPPHPAEPARQEHRPPAPAGLPSEPLPRLESQWSDILRTLRGRKGKRFDLGALLRSSTERQIADGTVVLKYSHPSHKERIEEELADPKSRKMLTDILEISMGGPYEIKASLADGQASGPKQNAAQRSHMVRAALAMGAKIVGEREEEPDDE
jgi:DNA polymerase-3 subunit gamma/tau